MTKTYIHTTEIHNTRSAKIVIPTVLELFRPASVLDVGCGTGTWLKVFKDDFSINDVFGLDAPYVEPQQLMIDGEQFRSIDLREPFDLKRKFDLVLCLEVAEHLPESSGATLIDSICRHSATVMFSAAIPGQGGQHHLNEQWIDYWEKLFNAHNYFLVDAIRPRIWADENVDVWYRQNLFLFVKEDNQIQHLNNRPLMALIHPAYWQMKTAALTKLEAMQEDFVNGGAGVRRTLRALLNAIRNKTRRSGQ